MKFNYLLVIVLLLQSACNMPFEKKPYYILNKCSKLNFNEKNASLIEFNENTAGIKGEGVIQGVFKMGKLNLDSLHKQLLYLGYKKLPINEMDMGDGFKGNVQQSDSGYYKLILLHESIIDQLIIVNFTQNKVIMYKLKS